MKEITVVIPCHNEAGSIGNVIGGVRESLPDAEILVIDDGSTDDTAAIAEAVDGVRVFALRPNRGKGVALRESIGQVATPYLIFMDGDGQDDPADLPKMVSALHEGGDLINGSKFIGVIEHGGISRPNYFGNLFMSMTINLLFGANISDSQSGFRAIRVDAVRRWNLRSTEYEIESEMLCKAIKSGLLVREIPVTRRARTSGATGFHRVRNGLRVLMTILRERFVR